MLPPVFNTYNVASCVTGVPMRVKNPDVNGYFNPAAFTVPNTVVGQTGSMVQMFGNCGHFVAAGPGSKSFSKLSNGTATGDRFSLPQLHY